MIKFKKESYIKQRYNSGSKKWSFLVRIQNKGISKEFSESKYGSARRAYDEAIIFRNKSLLEDRNIHINNQNITLGDVFGKTFDYLPVREETKRKHIIYFNKYIGNENRQLRNINKADIVMCLNAMINTCSDDSINRILTIWKRIFKTAILNDYISYDLTIGIVAPKSQMIAKPKKDVITDRHTLTAVEAKIYQRFEPLEAQSVCTALEVMWYTGLRPAECFALSCSDIENGLINVSKELGSDMATSGEIKSSNFNVIRRCKTDASIRQIPIPTELNQILDLYHPKGDILFPNKHGEYFNLNYLGQKIHSLGIKFNMYQLRHTLSAYFFKHRDKIDERTIIDTLGHENLNMSIYYARSDEERMKKALEGR